MKLGKSAWRTWEEGISREWLLTNGIGGYAASAVNGANTRRYHGLLIASLQPPAGRRLILSKLDETAVIGNREYELHSFCAGGVIRSGYDHVQSFEYGPLPTYVYSVGDAVIKKTVCMVYGENSVIVHYGIRAGMDGLKLRLTPLVNFRDHHGDSHRQFMRFEQEPFDNGTVIRPYGLDLRISLGCGGARFLPFNGCWFENMEYPLEKERGLTSKEDHYIPGYFELEVGERQEKQVTFYATIEPRSAFGDCSGDATDKSYNDGLALIRREEARIKSLVETADYEDDFASSLVAAADKFLVRRKSTGGMTVIAGYPWFDDWGRDAMISLCGLTLVTGRFEDARSILHTFSKYVKYGLVPNMLPAEGEEPAYNSVDASLWYFEAANKYLRYTGDIKFVKERLYGTLVEICEAFTKGTLFDIGMDADHLISAGNPGTQLTWMDARVGSQAVTPRQGKAVEINALWYNALRILERLAPMCGGDATAYGDAADKAGEAFRKTFWNGKDSCLYDVVNGEHKDDSIRPNQIIAASLSYPVIEGDMAKAVVDRVWKDLYTSYGLRTLSQDSAGYRGIYAGDPYARDSAYHQGTAWAWLLGPFMTAFSRVYGGTADGREILASFYEPLKEHLSEACVGNVSEIFDGDEPLFPRGCPAQAWSVAEVLRSYIEDYLGGAGRAMPS